MVLKCDTLPENEVGITVTETALLHIQKHISKNGAAAKGLRLGVKKSGCSGYEYDLSLVSGFGAFDYVFCDKKHNKDVNIKENKKDAKAEKKQQAKESGEGEEAKKSEEKKESKENKKMTNSGVMIVIDKEMYLKFLKGGIVIDFKKEGLSEGLKIQNPNVANECGCGESFNLKSES